MGPGTALYELKQAYEEGTEKAGLKVSERYARGIVFSEITAVANSNP